MLTGRLQFRVMIDPDLQARARKLEPRAVEEVLNVFYPIVFRMATGLTGQEAAGQRVTRTIMRRAIDRMPHWANEGDSQRWFHHHTVLTARRAGGTLSGPMEDVLVTAEPSPSPQYVAFIRAIRSLPFQQREAIILHDGEQLQARALAVAMDCSTEAASNHLAVGRRDLLPAAGGDLNRLLAVMREAYHRLTPQEGVALPLVKRVVRRVVWPRRIWRLVRVAIVLATLCLAAWLAWTYWGIVDW